MNNYYSKDTDIYKNKYYINNQNDLSDHQIDIYKSKSIKFNFNDNNNINLPNFDLINTYYIELLNTEMFNCTLEKNVHFIWYVWVLIQEA